MSVKVKDVCKEFPQDKSLIQELLVSDTHFAAVVERYKAVNNIVIKLENSGASIKECELFKKKRNHLQNEVHLLLEQFKVEQSA